MEVGCLLEEPAAERGTAGEALQGEAGSDRRDVREPAEMLFRDGACALRHLRIQSDADHDHERVRTPGAALVLELSHPDIHGPVLTCEGNGDVGGDDGRCLAQVREWHGREQVMLDLIIQPAHRGVEQTSAADVSAHHRLAAQEVEARIARHDREPRRSPAA